MNQIYAKIASDGVVVNIQILSSTDIMDPAFTWVNITTTTPQPCPGWTYASNTFTESPLVITGYVDTTQSYLQTGTESTFSDFTLSEGYLVHLNGEYINIGCQSFDALFLRYALYQIINLAQTQVGYINIDMTGNIGSAGFYVSPISAGQILTALSTINFDLG